MDAVVRVQLTPERSRSSQQYVAILRDGLTKDPKFADLEFAFDAGGMIHAAMNEGKSTPISIRVTGKKQEIAHQVAAPIRERVAAIDGVVDARIIQRLNYPEYMDQRRPQEGGRPGPDPGGRHAQRRGRPELEHPVQQEELLDRPAQQEPVLRRRPVPREGHQDGRDDA